MGRPCEILLVEDNPGDIRLTQEILSESGMPVNLQVARDGVLAMQMLRKEGAFAGVADPDLILLDLNLPRKDGREVLAELKADPRLRRIPVLVLTTSRADHDVAAAYDLHANCYLNKPVNLDEFADLIASMEDFWFRKTQLPPKPDAH